MKDKRLLIHDLLGTMVTAVKRGRIYGSANLGY